MVGVLIAPPALLERSLGLDVVFPAFFVLLLFDELRVSVRARAAGLLGGVLTALLLLVLPVGPALIGGSTAALLGLIKRGSR